MSGAIWRIEFEQAAAREFGKLDPPIRRRIRAFFEDRILHHPDPRQLAKPLQGQFGQLWRFRVGNYRIVCDIRDRECLILVLRTAHRRKVYD